MDEQSPYLSLSEAGSLSGYSAEYLRQLCVKGKLKGEKIGKAWLVSRSEFERFMNNGVQSQTSQPEAEPPVSLKPVSEAAIEPIIEPTVEPQSSFQSLPFLQKSLAFASGLLLFTTAAFASWYFPSTVVTLKTEYDEVVSSMQQRHVYENRQEYTDAIKDYDFENTDPGVVLGEITENSQADPALQPETKTVYVSVPQTSQPIPHHPTVLGITNDEIISAFRVVLQEGLPQDILTQLKGPKGDKGDKGEEAQHVPVAYTVPTSTNVNSIGSIAGVTHLSGQEVSTQKLYVTSDFVQSGGTTTLKDTTIQGSLLVTGNTTTLSDLNVTGSATFGGALTIGSSSSFTGTITSNGQFVATRPPTLAHMFAPSWPTGASNVSDSTIYINPASSVGDGNLIGAAVNGTVKFVVDAEGDIYGNNLVLTGSTTTGATTIAGSLSVQDNTTLGDATSDFISLVGHINTNATFRKADPSIVFDVTTASDTDFWAGAIDDAGGDDDDTFQIGKGTTPGTTPFISVDTTGRLGIGTTAPTRMLTVIDQSVNNSSVQLTKYVDSANGPAIRTARARGTEASPTGILAGDGIAGIVSVGYHSGGAFSSSGVGSISLLAAENFGPLAWGTIISFETNKIGTVSRGERLRIGDGGNIYIGDTANANATVGLTINQDVNDDEIITLKSSDITHSMTARTEADTYANFLKRSGALGGLQLSGFSDGDATGLFLDGNIGSNNPTDTVPAITLRGTKFDGVNTTTDIGALETVLRVDNNATSLLTLLGNGNVGIGTTNPIYKLDTSGIIRSMTGGTAKGIPSGWTGGLVAEGSGTPAVLWVDNAGANRNWIMQGDASGNLLLKTFTDAGVTSDKVAFLSSGNVGIGTTTAPQKLTLGFGTSIGWAFSSGNSGVFHKIGHTDDGNGPIYYDSTWSGTATDVIHNFRGNGSSSKMVITEGGNVGIGTTSPGKPLEVYSTSADATVKLNAPTATQYSAIQFNEGATTGGYVQYINSNFSTAARRNNLEIYNANSGSISFHLSSPTPAMYIQGSSGNVGIGTTNPSAAKLQVYGSGDLLTLTAPAAAAADPNLTIDGSARTGGGIGILTLKGDRTVDGHRSGIIYFYDASNLIGEIDVKRASSDTKGDMVFSTSGSERMIIDEDGNVGIGTTTATYKLDILHSQNTASRIRLTNANNGTTAQAMTHIENDAGNTLQMGINSSGFTTSGLFTAGTAFINANAAPLLLQAAGGSNFINFATPFGEVMRLTSAGEVGIGTSVPGRTLHVKTSSSASVAIDAAGTSDSGLYFYRAGAVKNVIFNNGSNSDVLTIQSVAGASTYIDQSGRVSLGATQTTPTSKLYVRTDNLTPASDTYNQMIVTPDGQAIDKGGSLALGGNTSTVNDTTIRAFAGIAGRKENGTDNNTAGYLALSTRANSGTALAEHLRITSTGLVGIGDTSPDYKLEMSDGVFVLSDADVAHGITGEVETDGYFKASVINGLSGGALLSAFADDNSTVAFRLLGVLGNNDPADTVAAVQILTAKKNGTAIADIGSSETAFQISDSNATDHFLTVLGSGNVGIGTTNPGAALQIGGSGQIFVPNGSVTNPSYTFTSHSQTGLFIDPNSLAFAVQGNHPVSFSATTIQLRSTTLFGWSPGAPASSIDVGLMRDASGSLALRNSNFPTTAQRMNIYNTFTDTSNYERMALDWSTTANVFRIATEAAGTGTVRNIALMGGNVGIGTTSPTSLLSVGANQFQVDSSGHVGIGTTPLATRGLLSNVSLSGDYPRSVSLNNSMSPNNGTQSIFLDINAHVIPPSGGTAIATGIEIGDMLVDSIAGTFSDLVGIRVASFSTKGALAAVTNQYSAIFNSPTNGSNNRITTVIGSTPAGPLTAGLYISGAPTGNNALIVNSGNVGIGTTTPTAKLEVVGNIISKGTEWTARSAAGNNDWWNAVVYGNGLYVAVGQNGDRVMTSPDGINWTVRSAAGNDDLWQDVTYGNGLFVAVSDIGDRVMTSPDGITWTARTAAGDNDTWTGVTYSNGLFVAVSLGGDRVMTSPDGVTWTVQTAAGGDDSWTNVTYGNGLFVAVGSGPDRVMTSPDGVTWTARSAAGDNDSWTNVVYGDGLFVAVGTATDRVMTSPDGVTWTARSAAGNDDQWYSVSYGNGLFVAVGANVSDRVMTSPDGITWTARSAAGDNDGWFGLTYGNGQFVAVSAGSDGAMTSGKSEQYMLAHNNLHQGGMNFMGNVGIGTTTPAKTLDVFGTAAITRDQGVVILTLTGYRSGGNVRNQIIMDGARGTLATPLTVNDADTLLLQSVRGHDGTSFVNSSEINFQVDGTVSTGIVPGRITFGTADTAGTTTERMRINSAGNVGIGVTTPQSLLTVGSTGEAQLTISSDTDNNSADTDALLRFVIDSPTAGTLKTVVGYDQGIDKAIFGYDAGNRIVVDSSGRVGIGTTGTTSRLSLRGTGTYNWAGTGLASDVRFDSSEMTDGADHSILQLTAVRTSIGHASNGFLGFSLIDDSNDSGVYDAARIQVHHESALIQSPSALSFWTNTNPVAATTAATEKMRITSAGSVGIGTTGPDSLLVVGDTSTAVIRSTVRNINSGTAASADLLVTNGSAVSDGLSVQTFGTGFTTAGAFVQDGSVIQTRSGLSGGLSIASVASAPIRFYTAGSADSNERMRIESGGNIGMGTTTAESLARLTVAGTEAASGGIAYWADEGDDNADKWLFYAATDGKFHFTDRSTGSYVENLTIDGNTSNIGIGTTAPGDDVGGVAALDLGSRLVVHEKSTSQGAAFFLDGNGYAEFILADQAAATNKKVLEILTDNGFTTFSPLLDSGSRVTTSLTIDHTNGNVGIGTTGPGSRLHSYIPNGSGDGVYAGIIENAQGSSNPSGLLVTTGQNGSNKVFAVANGASTAPAIKFYIEGDSSIAVSLAGTQNTVALCHSVNGTNSTAGSELVDCSGAPSDIAEWYDTKPDVSLGHVVSVSDQTVSFNYASGIGDIREWDGKIVEDVPLPGSERSAAVLKKSPVDDSATVIGVVSTAPYQTLGEDVLQSAQHPQRIALSGRVPVKVTEENGPIKAGDRLTTSKTVPGYAAKMKSSGQSIGIALEPLVSSSEGKGEVLVFINLGYQRIDIAQDSSGQIIPQTDKDLDMNGFAMLNVKSIASINGKWSIDENGNLAVKGHILVGKDTAGSVTVPAGLNEIQVTFEQPYAYPPKITASPLGNAGSYWISEKTVNGFKIKLLAAVPESIEFDWHALAVEAPVENNTASNPLDLFGTAPGNAAASETPETPDGQESGDPETVESIDVNPPAETDPPPVSESEPTQEELVL